jgi:hypothetical protein
MSTPRRSVLVAALGGSVNQDPALLERFGGEDGIKKAIVASIHRAKEAGFDVSNIALNPTDIEDSRKRLEEKLKSQDWDGLLIGFGIRGNKDYTELFEEAVNLAKDVTPRTRLLFGKSPDDLYATLQRNFPAAE